MFVSWCARIHWCTSYGAFQNSLGFYWEAVSIVPEKLTLQISSLSPFNSSFVTWGVSFCTADQRERKMTLVDLADKSCSVLERRGV